MALITTLLHDLYVDGTIFDFELKGDVLPDHMHLENANHISVMARGSVDVTGDPSLAGQIIEAGDVIDWPANVLHGFVAREDNTRMVQIQKKRQ